MLRHFDAIYEHGVLRPIEPLVLPERQRVHLTLDEAMARTAEPPKQTSARHNELRWLAKESAHYAGEWVALDGSRLVAHGERLAPVSAAAKAAGVAEPFFARVPRDRDLPFGGW